MNLSHDSMMALQRHFLGALSAPARTWLEPLPPSPLLFLGDAIRFGRDGLLLDFGTVVSPGQERRELRICNRGPEPIEVGLGERPPWLRARWLGSNDERVLLPSGNAGARLEAIVTHEEEREFRGTLRFDLGNEGFDLCVSMSARCTHPGARFDFNGSLLPAPFEFGSEDQSYRLSVANATSIPLVVTFADLPPWLAFEVEGKRRNGPIAGTFFERAAPFSVTLRSYRFGRQEGALRLRTNDPRPEMQEIDLRFAARLPAEPPGVQALPTRRVQARVGQSLTTSVGRENSGRLPATTSRKAFFRPQILVVVLALLFLTLLLVLTRGLP